MARGPNVSRETICQCLADLQRGNWKLQWRGGLSYSGVGAVGRAGPLAKLKLVKAKLVLPLLRSSLSLLSSCYDIVTWHGSCVSWRKWKKPSGSPRNVTSQPRQCHAPALARGASGADPSGQRPEHARPLSRTYCPRSLSRLEGLSARHRTLEPAAPHTI